MGRTARDRRPNVPPVQKIELSARHTRLRLALAALLLVIGALCLAYAFNAGPEVEAGWTEIDGASAEANCAGDFTFLYPLGTTASPAAEQRALTTLYAEACADAYRLFTADAEFEGQANLATLNAHPNEEFAVDEALYAALRQIVDSGDRTIYLAPIYEVYDGIFSCGDPALTADFDPRQNEALRAWCAEVSAYANDPEQVNIELPGQNHAVLKISEEYLAWARAEEISSFVDFYWLRNAFVADYLAQRITDAGYAIGTLSSRDGFQRNLDAGEDTEYAVNLFDWNGTDPIPAATLRYHGARAIVALRNFPINAADAARFAPLPDGSFATRYLDAKDGLCKFTPLANALTAYSETAGCAEIALRLAPLFISDAPDEEALAALSREGIQSVYLDGGKPICTDPSAEFANVPEASPGESGS